MKKIILIGLSLFISFVSYSQITIMAKQLPQPAVTILKTEPEQPIEGGRVIVYFRFNNPYAEPLNGWIGADLNSGTSAPGKSIIDWPIIQLEKGQSVDGAIMVNTTDAGTGKTLRVFFYESQETRQDNTILKSKPKYEIGEKEINIAALVNFKLNSFTINHTRAHSTDTDWGSLYAVVDDVPIMESASIYIGNFQDGTYPFKGKNADDKMIENMETGPVALVPGQNSSLYIAYSIYNGGGINDSKSFLKGYAEATANPIMFHGPRPGTSDFFTAIKVLNPFFNAIGACDGFVVIDTITINTNGIFSNTKEGNRDFSKRYNSEEYSSQNGCGNTSDYTVNSSIKRLSNFMNSSLSKPPVFTKVTQQRTINLAEQVRVLVDVSADKNPYSIGQGVPLLPQVRIHNNYEITWQRIETIEKSGNFVEMNDPAYGYVMNQKYHSPAQIDRPLLVILRGLLINNLEPNSLSILNNGQLKQVTAIIQLIPGVTEMKKNSVLIEEKTIEDYGKKDTTSGQQKMKENFVRHFDVTGDWRFKITSSGGAVFTGKVNLQQDGTNITGNIFVNDNTKTKITGTFTDNVLNLSRDTGLETIQIYQLTKTDNTHFSGAYKNQGKYPDLGTVEFYK